ncbi:MAG: SLAP domain-containing protein, partial [Lactobacillus delbrueckii]|nr:SLAP domain-containing protein [Lactobacillus delbrueckii]
MGIRLSIAAKAALAIALLGASVPGTVVSSTAFASSKYTIKTVKKAYVYDSKGKKGKKFYNKNASVTAFGTKWIKGKKYYSLGKGRYIRTANAKKPAKYSYSTQTRKITRTIKMYQPKGVKKVVQKAYIKRTVKTNLKSHKKTYGKWSTSRWAKYKVAKVAGYTASRASV